MPCLRVGSTTGALVDGVAVAGEGVVVALFGFGVTVLGAGFTAGRGFAVGLALEGAGLAPAGTGKDEAELLAIDGGAVLVAAGA
jgi:hypothetical protein